MEEVQKDLGDMSTEEQRAAVMRDAPELAALLADLQSSLAEVRSRLGPLLKEVCRVASEVHVKGHVLARGLRCACDLQPAFGVPICVFWLPTSARTDQQETTMFAELLVVHAGFLGVH